MLHDLIVDYARKLRPEYIMRSTHVESWISFTQIVWMQEDSFYDLTVPYLAGAVIPRKPPSTNLIGCGEEIVDGSIFDACLSVYTEEKDFRKNLWKIPTKEEIDKLGTKLKSALARNIMQSNIESTGIHKCCVTLEGIPGVVIVAKIKDVDFSLTCGLNGDLYSVFCMNIGSDYDYYPESFECYFKSISKIVLNKSMELILNAFR